MPSARKPPDEKGKQFVNQQLPPYHHTGDLPTETL
jgi:hypothetical protein